MKTINVIGAGIAGSVTATLLRSEGFDVRVIDDHDMFSASQASSNLFVAEWYKKQGQPAVEGFQVLERLYGKVTERPFTKGIGIAKKMLHIRQEHLLVKPDVVHTVTYADRHGVTLGDGTHFDGPIVLCCGYRHNALSVGHREKDKLDIEVYAGHRVLLQGDLPDGGTLSMVAPYKHGKLYQYAPGQIYWADSVKIKLNEYRKRETELLERTLHRGFQTIGQQLPILDIRVGYRPIIKDAPFAVLTGGPDQIWSINGGGSNGVVAYAYRANQLLQELRA